MLSITAPDSTVSQLTLGRTESRLLFFLLNACGDIKSRNEIIEYVWDDRVVGPGSLNQAIFSLRNILEDNVDHEILITVPRRGYRFNQSRVITDLEVVPAPEAAPAPTLADENLLPDAATTVPTALNVEKNIGPFSAIKELSSAKKVLLGYLVVLPLVFFAGDRLVTTDSSRIQISHLKSNQINLHFIALTLNQALDFKKKAEPEIEKLPSSLKGDVWVVQNQETYSVACIRPDRSTYNLSFSINKITLPEAIKKCLEKTL